MSETRCDMCSGRGYHALPYSGIERCSKCGGRGWYTDQYEERTLRSNFRRWLEDQVRSTSK